MRLRTTLLLLALAPLAPAQTWEVVPGPAGNISHVEVDPTDADHLLLWSSNQGWYETHDAGQSWSNLAPPTPAAGLVVHFYAFDSRGEVQAVLGQTSQGGGAAFQLSMVRRGGGWIPYGPTLGSSVGITNHYDGAPFVRGIVDTDLVAYTVGEPFDFGSARLFLSDDDGVTWTDTGQVAQFGRAQIIEGTGGPRVLRFSDGSDYANSRFWIERSSAWGPLDEVLYAVFDQRCTHLFAERQVDRMYRVISDFGAPSGPLERSDDGGVTWQVSGPDGAHQWMGVHPVRPDWLARWLVDRIEVSTDAGASWSHAASANSFRRFAFSGEGRYLYGWNFWTQDLGRIELSPEVGIQECSAQPNGSGQPGRIRASGSASATENSLTLVADRLPAGQFGMFLVSQSAGFVPAPGGSFGDLCLGGAIGRFNDVVLNSGAHGAMVRNVDLSMIPTPTQFVAAGAGQTWRFQAWHRDVIGGVQGSHFTDAVAVTVTP